MPSKLIAVGVSHHSVPVQYREMVALSADETKALLERLKESFTDEALVVSTCNRSEIYVRPINDEISSEYLIDLLFELKQIPTAERPILRDQFVKLSYCEAITHLFEVTAGIDSQILGDQQIFAQVKDSFRMAEEARTSGTFITKLAHAAFRVAKRVRNETHLTEGASTISYAAVEFARKVYDDLRNRTALIIGAGETAELTISYLLEKKIGHLLIANRSKENAQALIEKLRLSNPNLARIKTIGLSEIHSVLPNIDIVISSTGSPEPILRKNEIEPVLAKRSEAIPIVMVDIAVPRDIDPEIASLPNVLLKDIDDLSLIVDQNLSKRKEEIPKIKQIIKEEFEEFLELFTKLEVGPTIAELRQRFEQIRQEELERNRTKLTPEAFAHLDDMTRKMMNRLLHTPTTMLKEPRTSKDDLLARIEVVRMLFALGEPEDKSH